MTKTQIEKRFLKYFYYFLQNFRHLRCTRALTTFGASFKTQIDFTMSIAMSSPKTKLKFQNLVFFSSRCINTYNSNPQKEIKSNQKIKFSRIFFTKKTQKIKNVSNC